MSAQAPPFIECPICRMRRGWITVEGTLDYEEYVNADDYNHAVR